MAKRLNRRDLNVVPIGLPKALEPADEIRVLHSEIVGLLETSLEKSARIGELLLEIKAELPHGEFTPWINEKLPFGDRMARKYMRVFENREQIQNGTAVPFSGVNRLLETVKKPPPDPPAAAADEPPGQADPEVFTGGEPPVRGVPPGAGAIAIELVNEYAQRAKDSRVSAEKRYLVAMIEGVAELAERMHRAGHISDRELKRMKAAVARLREGGLST